MTEESKRVWDIVLGIAGALATIITILIGISQFTSQERTSKEIEFQKEMWKKQVEDYSKICEIAGTLSSEFTPDSLFKKNREEFEKKYWGTLTFAPDTAITGALINFREELHDYDPANKDKNSLDRLKRNAVTIAEVMNRSLTQSWKKIGKE